MGVERKYEVRDEWYSDCDDIAMVLDGRRGLAWFGYRQADRRRVGPFRSRAEAERALHDAGAEAPPASAPRRRAG
jgi:hypothetical protein